MSARSVSTHKKSLGYVQNVKYLWLPVALYVEIQSSVNTYTLIKYNTINIETEGETP
jgi:hypothetical protein